jgi:serine phosphatase RsbU (regulator of sigma subunit)
MRLAVIAVLIAAGFALRAVFEGDPGPLFLAPTLLAAFWFGRVGGVSVGILSTVAFVLARELNPEMMAGTFLAAAAYRLVAYTAAGYAFGWLVEDRRSLRAEVDAGHRNMAELLDLQEALAPPEMPSRPALELASCYVPAEGGAGGDFFLVAPGPGDATVVVVGDVAGKGLQAAKRAAYVRMGFAAAAPFQDNPCRLLELANTNLIERAGVSDIFVTAACFVLKPAENKLTWALAGHPPPLLLADGQALTTIKSSFPLGIGEDIDCELGEAELEPGAGFVAFTDGLIEARRRRGPL